MNLSDMCVLLLGNPGIEIHQTHSLISIPLCYSFRWSHSCDTKGAILGGHDSKLIWKTHITVLLL